MIKKILIALFITIAGFCIYVAKQPSHFRVERSIAIDAPASVVFANVNDLHKFDVWNPWSKVDPQAKQAYEGAAAGVGAISTWNGNNEVGSGRMTIVESQPSTLVKMKLEMFKPMPATNDVEFTFKTEGNQTITSWIMTGESNFIGRAICVFMDMDTMVGGMFEKGLASLKAVSEIARKK